MNVKIQFMILSKIYIYIFKSAIYLEYIKINNKNLDINYP